MIQSLWDGMFKTLKEKRGVKKRDVKKRGAKKTQS
jgi:hypothetical protein